MSEVGWLTFALFPPTCSVDWSVDWSVDCPICQLPPAPAEGSSSSHQIEAVRDTTSRAQAKLYASQQKKLAVDGSSGATGLH